MRSRCSSVASTLPSAQADACCKPLGHVGGVDRSAVAEPVMPEFAHRMAPSPMRVRIDRDGGERAADGAEHEQGQRRDPSARPARTALPARAGALVHVLFRALFRVLRHRSSPVVEWVE